MPHALAYLLSLLTTVLAVAGMGYFWPRCLPRGSFWRAARAAPRLYARVSILKSLKGLDPGMIDAFRSHCRQSYAGEYELLFGVLRSPIRPSQLSNNCRLSFLSARSG